MAKTRVYLAEKLGQVEDVFLVTSYYAGDKTPASSFLFSPTQPLLYNFKFVDSIADADLVLLPQPITVLTEAFDIYQKKIRHVAETYGKPVAVFVGGDFSHLVNVAEFVVFKGTQYRRFLKENEIIIPAFCEDLGATQGVIYRKKKSLKPVVSFCGWAGFDTSRLYLKYFLRTLVVEVQKWIYLDPTLEIFKRGLYFRRKALSVLSASNLIETRFIIRKSFSGHAKTIQLSPAEARQEYVANMIESDFVLAPKGDANYSVRFFEALSLGRIPIVIDTETCLPLENVIDYSKCILRVSYKDMNKLPEIISDFYNTLTDQQFIEMQHEARRVYETYLRYDSFFNFVLPTIAAKKQTMDDNSRA